MASGAYDRFRASMNIGYEQWHDGIGYDLAALDELSERERNSVEASLVARAESDWRDLEALDRLGTPRAVAAILRARESANPEIRLHAHTYGPPPSPADWDRAIPYAIGHAEPFAGLVHAMRLAEEHPSRAVVDALWKRVLHPPDAIAYHCGECLATIAGAPDHRSLFLRLNGPARPDRDAAVRELEALCRGTAAERE